MAEIRCRDLPDECWELIFNRLEHHSHYEALSIVCKRFLSITVRLRNSFKIVNPTILIHGTLSKLFNRFHHLKAIDLSTFRGDLEPVILEIASSGLNLEALDVSGSNSLPVEGLKLLGQNMKSLRVLNCAGVCTFCDIELVAIANSMPWLEELDISYPRTTLGRDLQLPSLPEATVTDGGMKELSSKLRGLRKINLSGHQFLSDRSLVSLSSNCVLLEKIAVLHCTLITQNGIRLLIRNSPNLSSVSADGIQTQRSSMALPLIESLACARGLSTLDIHSSVVSDGFLCSLAMSAFPLKRFTLARCSDFTFSGISSLLQTYQSLEYLALTGVGFLTDNHISDLSKYLCALTTIKLNLCSKLTGSTFFALAKNCPLLKDIDLRSTNLGKGEESTVDFLVKNPQIKSLNLAWNSNLSDECLGKLASICPDLEMLDVSSCLGITEEGVANFLKGGSKVRHLRINECRGIKNIGTGFELPKLEVVQATRSGIAEEGLVMIGSRCSGLLNLDLEGCFGATTVGLKEIVKNCRRLREINFSRCVFASTVSVDWMVFSRPSLRKIIPPTLPTESQRKLFLRHGCLVCQG